MSKNRLANVDPKEFELPETFFEMDIDNKVFQGIVLQCLSQIEGITLIGGNFIDHILGRDQDRIKGVHVEQDRETASINVKIEVNIEYSRSIPQKAEEIQTKLSDDITRLTGLHVGTIHVLFRNVIPKGSAKAQEEPATEQV
ncbi:MAG: Asp23/Gls24 family envelope stress response protein [Chlamydiia bacterium]|nr:Asp23/Gls24 family envelope stress response protein [Chlamydiia bacterium]